MTTTTLRCPECGAEVWDLPHGHKLAKCWNTDSHANGGTLAFDTIGDDEMTASTATLRHEMPNGATVSDWLGTAMTAARVCAGILEDARGTERVGESDLRRAADEAAQALAEIVAVMDRYGMAHGYGENVTFP